MMKQNDRSLMQALSIATGLGIEAAALIAVGVGLGRGADCLLGAEPFGTVMGVLLGVGCAMRSVYCRVMRLK
ncbi:MAG: AtpZ/AtpI family protein [Selenomonadales bacterium]|jgi:F0F1-type ATP synthase assembly protein I|nr:AtpZ/AtpI family protein [Selenomonadales bacterium]